MRRAPKRAVGERERVSGGCGSFGKTPGWETLINGEPSLRKE